MDQTRGSGSSSELESLSDERFESDWPRFRCFASDEGGLEGLYGDCETLPLLDILRARLTLAPLDDWSSSCIGNFSNGVGRPLLTNLGDGVSGGSLGEGNAPRGGGESESNPLLLGLKYLRTSRDWLIPIASPRQARKVFSVGERSPRLTFVGSV